MTRKYAGGLLSYLRSIVLNKYRQIQIFQHHQRPASKIYRGLQDSNIYKPFRVEPAGSLRKELTQVHAEAGAIYRQLWQ